MKGEVGMKKSEQNKEEYTWVGVVDND